MAIRDFASERLFVAGDLATGHAIELDHDQAHYLINVLRLEKGARLLVFNGRDGEWEAHLSEVKKRAVLLAIDTLRRPQETGPDIDYLFAPLKRGRLDFMVQKATEMGVARLRPVITARTIAERVKVERMRANVIEAAEQCGVLRVPEVLDPIQLETALDRWDHGRTIIFCDENNGASDPISTLRQVRRGPIAVLVGPEGGFTHEERGRLKVMPFVTPLALGPRIMRADTAAVAALALVNAVLGDWRGGSS